MKFTISRYGAKDAISRDAKYRDRESVSLGMTVGRKVEEVISNNQVISDGMTVWVNGPDGDSIGRFSRFGIDLHRTSKEQMEGLNQCLDCTQGKPGEIEWGRFKKGLETNYGVKIPDRHKPKWLSG